MSTNAPASGSTTVSTSTSTNTPTPPTTAPTAAKRKYDEIVASFPVPTAKKKKAKRSPNAARSTPE
ncbi:hypothetical protein DFH08DRAFT_968665 [Mycena albidolilacea]|uniref:Uncharacterized protein n=1 Tax=Mycena albidolilacea TaxID=1033008 RepID=A0AAD6ZIQ6_9AGAR|nr:hypothetical protein DFH08DRAFT_968665 [Mycena albidolilacea]